MSAAETASPSSSSGSGTDTPGGSEAASPKIRSGATYPHAPAERLQRTGSSVPAGSAQATGADPSSVKGSVRSAKAPGTVVVPRARSPRVVDTSSSYRSPGRTHRPSPAGDR